MKQTKIGKHIILNCDIFILSNFSNTTIKCSHTALNRQLASVISNPEAFKHHLHGLIHFSDTVRQH